MTQLRPRERLAPNSISWVLALGLALRHRDAIALADVDAFVPHGRNIKATGTEIAYLPNPGGTTPVMGEYSNHKVDGSLDTTGPIVSSISFADRPGLGDDETYGAGDLLAVRVSFGENVLVTGRPSIELNIGGATTCPTRTESCLT